MVVLLTLLVMVLAFCLIAGFLMALALGIGLLLKACVPTLQLGHAVIAGAVVGPATLYFFRRLMNAINSMPDDDDGIPDDHPVLVLPRDFLHRLPGRSKPKRKKK